jgi:hypothetical protein
MYRQALGLGCQRRNVTDTDWMDGILVGTEFGRTAEFNVFVSGASDEPCGPTFYTTASTFRQQYCID